MNRVSGSSLGSSVMVGRSPERLITTRLDGAAGVASTLAQHLDAGIE